MKLYRTADSVLAVRDDGIFALDGFSFDALYRADEPEILLEEALRMAHPISGPNGSEPFLAPLESQEVWAAGVTWQRSRTARMEESESAGAARFYDLVYDAPRPELFFKATAPRTRGHLDDLRVRSDSRWTVPEPEVAIALNARGRVFGFSIGNDMSARDIEGENPLYLPQAKIYRGSCAIGPCLLVASSLPAGAAVHMAIERNGEPAFADSVPLDRLKRTFDELAGWLFRDNEFPAGCLLLTGTGIVPPGQFTLAPGDRIRIAVDGIGELVNSIQQNNDL